MRIGFSPFAMNIWQFESSHILDSLGPHILFSRVLTAFGAEVKTPAAPAAPVVSTPADAGTAPSEEAVLPAAWQDASVDK